VRFNQGVSDLADDYLRSILEVEKNAKVPEVSLNSVGRKEWIDLMDRWS
jgi:hypothetical protein